MTIRKKCDDNYSVLEARIVSHIYCEVIGKYRDEAIRLGSEILDEYQAIYGNSEEGGFFAGEYFSRFKQDTKYMGFKKCLSSSV